MIDVLLLIGTLVLFMVRHRLLIRTGGSERVIVVRTSVVYDRFGCSKPPGQDNKNTFAFGYADLGKLDSQTQEAIATGSVHLVFSNPISL